MKSLKFILVMLICYNLKAQTKLAPDIYMQNDPTHIAKLYKNVVFKTNADGRVNDAIIEMFTNHGYNVYSYYSLFPAIREYTKEEIDKVLKEKNIDLNLVIDVQSSNFTSPVKFNTYMIGNSTMFSGGSGNTVNMFFSMFFFEINSENPFVRVDGKVYSEGTYSKRARPLAMKYIGKSLNGLYENKVILKPTK